MAENKEYKKSDGVALFPKENTDKKISERTRMEEDFRKADETTSKLIGARSGNKGKDYDPSLRGDLLSKATKSSLNEMGRVRRGYYGPASATDEDEDE